MVSLLIGTFTYHQAVESEKFLWLLPCKKDQSEKLGINKFSIAKKISPPGAETHDDVIKWKHFPRYWSFVRGIHRSTVMFSLICTLNKRLSKQSSGWWFEMPLCPLWRHRNVEYFRRARSIPWLLMPWLLELPCHQQQQYWLCRLNRSLSSMRWNFKQLNHLSVKKKKKPFQTK